MSLDNDIVKWLTRELTKERGDKPIQKIVIKHASPGSKGNDVETIDLSERISLTSDDLPAIADDIISRAQTDTDGIGSVNRYVINLIPKGENKVVARFPFRLRANVDEFEEAGDEPANQRGLLMQLMRHNEAMAKTLVHSVSGITSVMARRLESSDLTIARLTEAAQKNMTLLEEAKSDQHGRDMELMEADRKSVREDKIFEKLSLLVPVVINKLAGQKVFNTDDPNVLMLKSFAESMSVDQFNKIQSTLSPEQALLLGQLMTGLAPKKALPSGSETS